MKKLNEAHLHKVIMSVILENADAELDEKYGKMTKTDAKAKLATIEKTHGKTFDAKLKAFLWADDPPAVLTALMRKAGQNQKKD